MCPVVKGWALRQVVEGSEKLNIQIDGSQSIYKNRILTHSPQQPAQETSLHSLSQTCRKSESILTLTSLVIIQEAKQ